MEGVPKYCGHRAISYPSPPLSSRAVENVGWSVTPTDSPMPMPLPQATQRRAHTRPGLTRNTLHWAEPPRVFLRQTPWRAGSQKAHIQVYI